MFEPKGAPAPFVVSARRRWLICALPLLLALCFVPGLSGGFVFDDASNITRHPSFSRPIESLQMLWEAMLSSGASAIGRPLSVLSFLANFQATGLDPFWFKLTNLGIHALNGVLLALLLARLFGHAALASLLDRARVRPDILAMVVAGAWTCLAIHASAVLLVVQRMELIAQTFVLVALLLYLNGRERLIAGAGGAGWRIAMALLVVPLVGVLAKESAILAPAYAFLLELYLLRFVAATRRGTQALLGLYGMLAAGAAAIAWLWLLPSALDPVAWHTRDFSLAERLWSEARIVWLYARWIVLPDLGTMSLYHDAFVISRGWTMPPTTVLAVAAIVGALALLAALARRPSLVGLGISWFFAAHLLTATVVPLELIFEHRNYFAAIGVLLLLAYAMLRLMAVSAVARRLAIALGAIFVIAQGTTAAWRAHEWGDPLAHAQAEAARNPVSPRAQYELGRVLYVLSDRDPAHPAHALALEQFERAARLPGASALPLQGLLIAEAQAGRAIAAERWEQLFELLHSRPLDRQSQMAVLSLVECEGSGDCSFPPERMVRMLGLAASSQPPDPDVLIAYASYALTRLHDIALAAELYAEAVRVDPANPLRRSTQGQFFAIVGRYDEAHAEADAMDRLDRWHRHRSKSAALRRFIDDLRRQRSQLAQ